MNELLTGPGVLLRLIVMFLFLTVGMAHATPQPKETPMTENTTKILIVLTNHGELGDTGKETGFYLSEVTHPYEKFAAASYDVTFISPKGGAAPVDGKDLSDPVNKAFFEDEALMARTQTTTAAADINAGEYQAIFFAGGHGTMWDFPDDATLQALTRDIYEGGGVVGAVCHGPAGLVNVRLSSGDFLIDGKRVTGFTNSEEAAVELTEVVPFALESVMRERGADFEGADDWAAHVQVSGRLVTGQNPASAGGVAEAIIALLAK